MAENWRVSSAGGVGEVVGGVGCDEVGDGLRRIVSGGEIRGAELISTGGKWELALFGRGSPRCRFYPNDTTNVDDDDDGDDDRDDDDARSGSGRDGGTTVAGVPVDHDRAKNVPLPPASRFLSALGVTRDDGTGKPRPGMSSKLRQCQKFVEVAGGLVDAALADQEAGGDSSGKKKDGRGRGGRIDVLDMGCGRGYLTFSLHAFLTGL